jgi:hypothetical protein
VVPKKQHAAGDGSKSGSDELLQSRSGSLLAWTGAMTESYLEELSQQSKALARARECIPDKSEGNISG